MPPFIHLNCHSEYSLINGLIRVKGLVKAVKEQNMPACAITDHNNLFALVKFYQAAHGQGIKPIVGVHTRIRVNMTEDVTNAPLLLLLCQNEIGYLNLTRLISKAYLENQVKEQAYIKYEWLQELNEGLIVLSGGREGDIGQALLNDNRTQVEQLLAFYKTHFPNRFYLELQRTGRPQEEEYIHAAVELAAATQTPVVATNAVCFLKAADFEAHEVRVCIHEGFTLADPRRPRVYSEQQYLRSSAEMCELFADIPEAIENTWHIAQRCNLTLTLGKNYLPDFPIPDGMTTEDYFRQQTRQGLEKRFQTLFKQDAPDFPETRKRYEDRLHIETEVIIKMGFPGYFLIVADFIQWAKQHDIPVGPGRGSGAGSLVAFALGITDLDPIPYDLLFERFLNPERVSMPDFDVDFCMDRRDDVIDYVANQYGRDKVSQIITYGSMAAKAVVRDVGRVLDFPYGFVDKIAKLIPFELGITLEKALESEEILRTRYEQEEEVRAILDMARKLEGLTRNVGKHAGGVVIAPSQLTDFSPLYCEADGSNLVTQFDKGDVESVGLVKFDFLGLRTLTIIKWALDNIKSVTGREIDVNLLPLDDVKAYELLQKAQSTAVFQLESRGMKELLKKLKPTCFEDIIALLALYRPGPIESGMVDDFVNRKNNPDHHFDYLHPELNSNERLVAILKPTYGVIAYQEQVMQIAQILSGYTLGGADLLRRAMGKKKPEEMAKQRSTFVSGAENNGIKAETANYVFDLVEKFAGYGFNKSHSAAYALISYQTAWLKTYYPAAFMAAVLSSDMDKTDKIVGLIDECRSMNLMIQPPNVNECEYKFTIDKENPRLIRYGLGAIKGVGENAIVEILKERHERGPFKDLFEFCSRIDLRKANRRVLEGLIKAGALDEFADNRGLLFESLDEAIKVADQQTKNASSGLEDLFNLGGSTTPNQVKDEPEKFTLVGRRWTESEKLDAEKESLGLYLTGHPINQYLLEIKQLAPHRLNDVKATERGKTAKYAGLVINSRIINSRRGKMATVTLDDNSGRLEVTLYSDRFEESKHLLEKDKILIVEGEVRDDEFSGGYTMMATQVLDLESARLKLARRLVMALSATQASSALQMTQTLEKHLSAYRPHGQCPVVLYYQHPDAQVELMLGEQWRVKPEAGLLQGLQEWLGVDKVKVLY